jgi:L-lactate utilization protein LutC
MTTSREAFLQRVRQAVAQGNRAGASADIPARGGVGYQGGGLDPVARFCSELTAAGGTAHVAPDQAAAVATVLGLVKSKSPRRVLLGRGPHLDGLDLSASLRALNIEVIDVAALTPATGRGPMFAAALGISGVEYLVAETGTVVIAARPDDPRSVSLLPPVHIAVASRAQLIGDLFDLFEAVAPAEVPSCLSLITGPSKTGDIELRLVTGVHGPGELHVVLIAG